MTFLLKWHRKFYYFTTVDHGKDSLVPFEKRRKLCAGTLCDLNLSLGMGWCAAAAAEPRLLVKPPKYRCTAPPKGQVLPTPLLSCSFSPHLWNCLQSHFSLESFNQVVHQSNIPILPFIFSTPSNHFQPNPLSCEVRSGRIRSVTCFG